MHERIIILDFGGQYAHLIASRIRRENVLAEIHQPEEITVEYLQQNNVKGIILSGGPQSVYEEESPKCNRALFEQDIPVLGICYGHQFLCHSLGGEVTPGEIKEFGRADLTHEKDCRLFKNIPETSVFWMSHGDEVVKLPANFQICGTTQDCSNAAVFDPEKNLYGIQFHPEVTHSEFGDILLKNFIDICEVSGDWTIEKYFEEHKKNLQEKIGDKPVILFVSGGVDSTVCFSLLSDILGADKVQGLFVDTGLLREGEVEFVEKSITDIGAKLTVLREADTFLGNLKGVTDPEKKREIIGNTFLEVQRKFFAENQVSEDTLLAQGTIYPDTIETGGTKNSSKIKTHHNRVPEIQKMIDEGKVIEPLADLYKDEVRALGRLLGLPGELVDRHPFPGPGLGVRILCSDTEISGENLAVEKITTENNEILFQTLPIKSVGVQGDFRTYRHPAVVCPSEEIFLNPPLSRGTYKEEKFSVKNLENISTALINASSEVNRALYLLGKNSGENLEKVSVKKATVTEDRVKTLQRADDIVMTKLFGEKLYDRVWQFPVVLVPVSFNGVGSEVVILRPIDSIDAMSASVGNLPEDFFRSCAEEILEDENISAVFLDITSKPPGTIEWE